MAARPDSTQMLATIDVPTLVISGNEDGVIPGADIEDMAERIPGAAHVTLQSGHLGNLENPAAFTEELRRFLDAVPLLVA